MPPRFQTIAFTLLLCLFMGCTKEYIIVTPTIELPKATRQTSEKQATVISSGLNFDLKDTGIKISPQRGNITWSHQGDRIAYTYQFTLWSVLTDQWDKPIKVYGGEDKWKVFPQFIAWAPNSTEIGLNLFNRESDIT